MTAPVINPHKDYTYSRQHAFGRMTFKAFDGTTHIQITEDEYIAADYEEHFTSHPDAYDADCASCFLNHPHSIGYHNQSLKERKPDPPSNKRRLSDVTIEELNQRRVALPSGFGTFLVSAITKDYWVRCPGANGGFGRSFCCHANTTVLISGK